MSEQLSNPADPEQSLKRSIGLVEDPPNPPQPIFPEDSAVTKAEKVERNGVTLTEGDLDGQEPAAKRVKVEDSKEGVVNNGAEEKKVDSRDKVKGIALVKTELVLCVPRKSYY
jgi:tRNA-dihydrouridine synthase 3